MIFGQGKKDKEKGKKDNEKEKFDKKKEKEEIEDEDMGEEEEEEGGVEVVSEEKSEREYTDLLCIPPDSKNAHKKRGFFLSFFLFIHL